MFGKKKGMLKMTGDIALTSGDLCNFLLERNATT